MNDISPWESRMMARYALTAAAVAQLRVGRRKDHSAVLRELRRAFDEMSFLVTIFPQLAGDFTVRTALECLDGRIEEIEATIATIAERARQAADDADGEADYA